MVMIQTEFIRSSHKFFLYYKTLGEKAISQLEDAQLFLEPSAGGNSIAIIVQHLSGNMHSRWSGFPNSDGESPTRNRDTEFELHLETREELLETWESGWAVVFAALERIEDVLRPMQIRGETITVLEAVQRQVAHYAHHVGQIVLLAKTMRGQEFTSLSIPRGGSSAFNATMQKANP
jgi:Protein of unknown function (DUF1572)